MKMHLSPFFCALWHDVKLCQWKVLETLQEEEFFFSVWFCCPGSTVHKVSLVFSSYGTHWPAVPSILHLPQQVEFRDDTMRHSKSCGWIIMETLSEVRQSSLFLTVRSFVRVRGKVLSKGHGWMTSNI